MLPVKLETLHTNELDKELEVFVNEKGAPMLVKRDGDQLTCLMDSKKLQEFKGSVELFEKEFMTMI